MPEIKFPDGSTYEVSEDQAEELRCDGLVVGEDDNLTPTEEFSWDALADTLGQIAE